MGKRLVIASLVCAAALAAALAWGFFAQAGGASGGLDVRGGGTSVVTGGTGPPTFTPVTTKFAFHWRSGAGRFECLALAPGAPAGSAGSGDFDTNVMYVTGEITSARVRGGRVVLRGSATVTGLGAGSDLPFKAIATRGGPGARLVLEVSGLTFDELLLEGEVRF